MKCRELLATCFINLFLIIHSSLSICIKLSPGCNRLNSVRAFTPTRSRPISVLYLLSKKRPPEDAIKSDEGASVTICWQVSSIIVRQASLRCVNGSTLSPVMAGRLPCGDNVVLALDSKDL